LKKMKNEQSREEQPVTEAEKTGKELLERDKKIFETQEAKRKKSLEDLANKKREEHEQNIA